MAGGSSKNGVVPWEQAYSTIGKHQGFDTASSSLEDAILSSS